MTLPKFQTWHYGEGPLAAWLQRFRGKSGVYTVRDIDSGHVLYIGESHSERLARTVIRHFQKWEGPTSGPTFNRSEVRLSVAVTDNATEVQDYLIKKWHPELNTYSQPERPKSFLAAVAESPF